MSRAYTVSDLAKSRGVLLAASLVYAWAIHYAHVEYLDPVWDYYGFTYWPPDLLDSLLIGGLVLLGGAVLPAVLARPSSIVLLLLFLVVYVPTIVITLCLDTDAVETYGQGLIVFGAAFAVACLGARARERRRPLEPREPDDRFMLVVLAAWAASAVVLVYAYGSMMRFVNLDSIYDQREAGRSTSLAMGYVQTYFSNVLSPALMAFGLLKSRWLLVVLGAIGCVIMFMINAQRTVFVLPFLIVGLHVVLSSRYTALRTSSFALLLLSGVTVLIAATYEDSLVATFFGIYLVYRTLCIPGLTYSQYYDLFSRDGFTWWSHVKGLNLLIPAPASYVNDSAWPNLGFVVGDRIYRSFDMNANANLFVGDGVAAAGALGVAVIGCAFAACLYWLDRSARGWDSRFTLLVLAPLAVTLTNGQLFTALLSFGGAFWMLTFYLYKPGRHA
jgi:hypothetical protein